MNQIRERQLAIVSLVRHFYENLFAYGVLAGLSGVVFGIAEAGNNPDAFLERAIGGQVTFAATLILIFSLIGLFWRLQSRREDIDTENHLRDEADRPVPPPY